MRCRIGRIAVSVRDHRNGFDQVSYRPTSLFSLDREAVLARGPAPDQVERDALDQGSVSFQGKWCKFQADAYQRLYQAAEIKSRSAATRWTWRTRRRASETL